MGWLASGASEGREGVLRCGAVQPKGAMVAARRVERARRGGAGAAPAAPAVVACATGWAL